MTFPDNNDDEMHESNGIDGIGLYGKEINHYSQHHHPVLSIAHYQRYADIRRLGINWHTKIHAEIEAMETTE